MKFCVPKLSGPGNFNLTEQFAVKYAGAAAMYFVSKKLKKYNITDECASLYDAAYTWTEALNGRNFLGILFSHTLKGTSYIDFLGPCVNLAFFVYHYPRGSKSNLILRALPNLVFLDRSAT
jgi:hypothetical protein